MRFLYQIGQLRPNFITRYFQIYHNSALIKQAVKKYLLTIYSMVVNKKLFIGKPEHGLSSFLWYCRQSPAVPACILVSVLIKGTASFCRIRDKGAKNKDFGFLDYLREWMFTRGPFDSAQGDGLGERVVQVNSSAFNNFGLTMMMLLLTVVIIGSSKPSIAQALKIGETLPTLKLTQVINHPEQSIILPQKGKSLLLIFWNAGCKTTRAQVASIGKLQSQFSPMLDIITLAIEPEAQVKKYILADTLMRNFSLPVVVGDTLLSKYLPHSLHPHIAWIDAERRLQQLTGPDYVTANNIQRFLNGEILAWPHKIDRPDFKIGRSSMLNEPKGAYSMVSPYLPGVSPGFKVWTDSLRGTVHTQVINFSAFKIYLMAFGRFLGIPPNQVIWGVKDRNNYQYHKNLGYEDEWKRKNVYCYESVLPIDTPPLTRVEKIRDDLNLALGLEVRMEERLTEVYVLKKRGDLKPSAGGMAANNFEQATPYKSMKNAGLGALLHELNYAEGNLPVLDETGFDGRMDMELYIPSFTNIPAIAKALAPYQLTLTKVKRPVSFLVFQERNPKPTKL